MPPSQCPPSALSTGIRALDDVLQGVCRGDNIVWQIEDVADYLPFVHAFSRHAARASEVADDGGQLVYFRFAQHAPLVPDALPAERHVLDPDDGFEPFIATILDVIERHAGAPTYYVFDCLSDLAVDWYSDVMLANFFMLTCPFLFEFDTATYFALFRNHNAAHATAEIHATAQVVLDLFKHEHQYYIHPVKVEGRYSPTMYMLHTWRQVADTKSVCLTVTDSVTTAEILSKVQHPWLDFNKKIPDVWTRNFSKARHVLERLYEGKITMQEARESKKQLLRMAIARDDRRLQLAEKYLDLRDLVNIGRRMIGTGLIGGKSVGMLLAQAILKRKRTYWAQRLEVHDSFFIGSDVFYTFLVKNGIWWGRRRVSDPATFLEGAAETRAKILAGTFPDYILEQFQEMLHYFGQSPIIVRSSSLLEDAYGNAFAGKYDSVFRANQGAPEERLQNFVTAVRTIYASAISEDALEYRRSRDLLDHDEQMAILVMRVSGINYGEYFFPHLAGAGFSFNPYVWDAKIEPTAGVIRLVFGLGTRAVNRTEDDYTRLVALNVPALRPETSPAEIRRYSQHKVDLIDLAGNQFATAKVGAVVPECEGIPWALFASRDEELARWRAAKQRPGGFAWMLTFDGVLENEYFVADFRSLLQTLEKAYGNPVDVEFTVNFLNGLEDYRINLLQCRPFQVRCDLESVECPRDVPARQVVFETTGPIIGPSLAISVDRLIYVVPAVYGHLSMPDRHALARFLGRLTRPDGDPEEFHIMLLGPGRWGTTSPSLGIPVTFAEINTVSVIGEIAEMHEGLIPDVSLGTHFFNDLVELDMLYFALQPERAGNQLNRAFFQGVPNALGDLVSADDYARWHEAVVVVDFSGARASPAAGAIKLYMDSLTQTGLCFLDDPDGKIGG